ncbi:MAG TPA: glycosyltransferase family A protein [Thermoanaerobaculia bacterium]|nr:glycosyltransferase family A protein [Thermoanaerobaculia bacterium]
MFRVIVNCGRCEEFIGECLASLQRQTRTDWQAQVTIDRDGDGTFERAVAVRGSDERIVITRNPSRLFPMRNLLAALERSAAAPEDVIVILDGDDWLIDERALERIGHAYDDGGWVTYGSWISNHAERPGCLPPYPDDTRDFREAPWLATAVRTWKKWLFDRIDPNDFRDERGESLRVAEDVACMFPLLEMATTRRARHIAEPLMLYNFLSDHDPGPELAREADRVKAWLRTRPRYAPIHNRPF